jgi:hypothetical protein
MSQKRTVGPRAFLLALVLGFVAVAVLLLRDGDDSGNAVAKARQASAPAGCSKQVSSIGAVQEALSGAPAGATICLADGHYDELVLDTGEDAPSVTVRPVHPGSVQLDGADLSGAHLTLAGFDVRGEVTVEPGSQAISILYNRISGGYFGLNAGPTDSTYISDTTVRGNRFVGPFGEDAIRLNRYHDSSDPDPYGILIEANEISGVRENGNHSDCLQSVWGGDGLYFRRNYLHDNRCQGFFVKDQPAPVARVVVTGNLMLRNAAPCAPPSADCGPPSIVQVFGPTQGLRFSGNTIWTAGNRSPLILREGPFGAVTIERNVIFRGWSDWSGGFSPYRERGDTVCQWEGTLPRLGPSSRRDCTPGFLDPAHDDYRLRSGDAGVSWAPAKRRYGPGAL